MATALNATILYKTNINKYILHVLSIKLRDKLYFSFSIPTPGFPHFYYMLGANLGLLLYGEVSVMYQCFFSSKLLKLHSDPTSKRVYGMSFRQLSMHMECL